MSKKKQSFEEMLQEQLVSHTGYATHVAALKEELKKAEEERDAKAQEIVRMKRLKELLNSPRTDILQWAHEREGEHTGYGNAHTWKEVWKFTCSMFEFRVYLYERPNYKRDKWEVRVCADKIYKFSTNVADGYHILGRHNEHTYYAENTYATWEQQPSGQYGFTPIKGQELLTRHKSEELARQHVALWIERLMADHKEELDYERNLAKIIQAPKPAPKSRKKTASGTKKEAGKKPAGKAQAPKTRRKKSA